MSIQIIAFDADDTLWGNEQYFKDVEHEFCSLLEDYLPQHTVNRELLRTEINNMPLYGYGIKAFMLSMIETALRISDHTLPLEAIDKIIDMGKEMLDKPVELLDGVEQTLKDLNGKYRLVMATKGDLLDQERKLMKSGLEKHFHHIEIMTEKKEKDYEKLVSHLDVNPEQFLMIGNSLKSDIIPVLNIGGHAIHVPYHVEWDHEKMEVEIENENFHQVDNIREVIPILT